MVRREHVSGKALMRRLEPPAGSADQSCQRRTWKIDSVAGEDLRLPIQGRVAQYFSGPLRAKPEATSQASVEPGRTTTSTNCVLLRGNSAANVQRKLAPLF